MAEVRVQEGESLENALRRFKRKVQTEDIIKEVKRQLLLSETGRKKTGQAGLGSQAEPKKAAKRRRIALTKSNPFSSPPR